MDFLLSYAGKFDMYVEEACATYVRYCFADPLDAAIFRSRFEPKSEPSGWRVEGAAELKSSRCGTTVIAPPGLRRPSQSASTGRSVPAAAAPDRVSVWFPVWLRPESKRACVFSTHPLG